MDSFRKLHIRGYITRLYNDGGYVSDSLRMLKANKYKTNVAFKYTWTSRCVSFTTENILNMWDWNNKSFSKMTQVLFSNERLCLSKHSKHMAKFSSVTDIMTKEGASII